MLLSGKLMQHLKETDEQAEGMLSQLVSQMAKAEGVTEQLKQQNQLKWVGLMENIHNRAMEIVCADIIYAWKLHKPSQNTEKLCRVKSSIEAIYWTWQSFFLLYEVIFKKIDRRVVFF